MSEPGVATSRLVIDACAAAKWVVAEAFSAQAAKLYEDCRVDRCAIYAPSLLPYEVTRTVYKRTRREIPPDELLTIEEAQEILRAFGAFRVIIESYDEIHLDAMALADRYGMSSPYDAHYLALARHLGCDFWTADERLWNAARTRAQNVFWLGDYPL